MSGYPLALSTIAMSAYNVLAMQGVMQGAQLYAALIAHHPDLPAALLDDALMSLCSRNLVRNLGVGFAVADPLRRLVRKRDRNGDGWGGWMVQGDDKIMVTLGAAR